MSRSTPSRACTGPKRLVTPFNTSTGSFALIHEPFVAVVPAAPGAPQRHPVRAEPSSAGSGESGRLACAGVGRRADLVRRPEAVLDDGVVDVVLRHRDRRQQ